jgi:hypothetical protein
MNPTTPLSRPRLVCRAVRLWATLADGGATSHAAACADCRSYFRACAALDGALRASASRESAPPPTGLENRILRAVAESRIQRPRRRFPLPLAVGAAASAAVLLAAAMFLRTAPEPDHPGEEIAVLLQTADSLAERWWNSVVPGTATLVHENALQQELTSVVAGARSALDFLALNFLPVAPAPSPQPAGTI